MKKICAVLWGIITLATFSPTLANNTCTIMVYMCGSNLESNYGAATKDIEEMMFSEFDEESFSLLVMTGGSKSWNLGFNSNQTIISEINADGFQPVWHSSKNLNMGDSSTLTQLLRFGIQNYPADSYALIVWNHGGGPLGGVCWDELFSMDNLSLSELTEGIKNAELHQKLSWIGFDACLMGSIEVANALSPYAEYMIASQETEPSSGWNYDFLSELDSDDDGATTGIKIIDSFFEGSNHGSDILTLSCLSLSNINEVIECMNSFFHSLSESVDASHFASLSNVLKNTAGFGKGIRGFDLNGSYDLVDLTDLIRKSKIDDYQVELEKSLSSVIIYSQSNIEGANGLSVYHPYANKEKYSEKWHTDYLSLRFCPGYTEYIEQFGAILTDAPMEQWRSLSVQEQAMPSETDHFFTLQLTENQIAHYSSAQMLILNSQKNKTGNNVYQLVSSVPAVLDQKGVLSAGYNERSLYVESEDGTLHGPLSLHLSTDLNQYSIFANYKHEEDIPDTNVLYFINALDKSDTPTVVEQRIWDDATEHYTNRLAFSEKNTRAVYFWDFNRVLPVNLNPLPDLWSWPMEENYMSGYILNLPQKWSFRYVSKQLGNSELFVLFQITDIQQNIFCTDLIPIKNPNITPFSICYPDTDNQPDNLHFSGKVFTSETDPSLHIIIQVSNNTDAEIEYRFHSFVLNDKRILDREIHWDVTPKETSSNTLIVTPIEVFDLEEIHSIACIMETINSATGERKQTDLHLDVVGCNLRPIVLTQKPLAEVIRDEETWKLLSLIPSSRGGVEGDILVCNGSSHDICAEGVVLINGLLAESELKDTIPANKEKKISFTANNLVYLNPSSFSVTGTNNLFGGIHLSEHLLQKRNENEIHEIRFLMKPNAEKTAFADDITLPLGIPYPLL